jgi:hypothetical protein
MRFAIDLIPISLSRRVGHQRYGVQKARRRRYDLGRRGVPPGMADGRQERVNRLREAYESYYAHFRGTGAHANDPATFDYAVSDDKKKSEVALKMALAEIIRPV